MTDEPAYRAARESLVRAQLALSDANRQIDGLHAAIAEPEAAEDPRDEAARSFLERRDAEFEHAIEAQRRELGALYKRRDALARAVAMARHEVETSGAAASRAACLAVWDRHRAIARGIGLAAMEVHQQIERWRALRGKVEAAGI